jgi:L-ascorbate metabolism protein UlaG (beta-lactamase superfamily)
MVITYFGSSFFKVQFGDTIIAYNPISKDSKLAGSKFGADIVLSSLNHPDFNGVEQVTYGDRIPFFIRTPGEYEIKNIFIKGFPAVSNYDGDTGRINTMFRLSLEGMNLCFLGALGNPKIPSESLEAFEDIDVLFVPIGGDGVITPAEAYKLAVSIEPKLIIPMHYGNVGIKGALEIFLKEAGTKVEAIDKLTLKKKDLEGKEGDIVVLSS